MGCNSSRSSVVRLGPLKRSRTTSIVHLSPINWSAPAIGQPSILRRRTVIPAFATELITNYELTVLQSPLLEITRRLQQNTRGSRELAAISATPVFSSLHI